MGTTSSHDFRSKIVDLQIEDANIAKPEYWRVLFLTAMTAEDIATYVTADDVRRLRKFRPHNLAALIYKCMEQINLFLGKKGAVLDYCCIVNALRMLSRILPTVLEPTLPTDEKLMESISVFSIRRRKGTMEESRFAQGFVRHFFVENSKCLEADERARFDAKRPLGEVLINMLTELAFVPGFTVQPPPQAPEHELRPEGSVRVFAQLLWTNTHELVPNAPSALPPTQDMVAHRADVLRAILCCMTAPVYTTESPFPFMKSFLTASICPKASTLVLSAFTTVCQYNPKGMLPFTSYYQAAGWDRLLRASFHLLNVVLDATATLSLESSGDEPVAVNACAASLTACLDGNTPACEIVCEGLVTLIQCPVDALHTVLPKSQHIVRVQEECTIFLWRLCTLTPTIVGVLCQGQSSGAQPFCNRLIVPLLTDAVTGFLEPSSFGQLQLAVFMLLRLSSERDFAVNLNEKSEEGKLPFQLEVADVSKCVTYGDILLLTICEFLSPDAPEWVEALSGVFATVLCNVSPYLTSVSQVVSYRLVKLLERFSTPAVLQENMRHMQCACYVVEALSNLVQYQFAGSVHMVYGLIQSDCVGRMHKIVLGDHESGVRLPENLARDCPSGTLMSAVHALTVKCEALKSDDPEEIIRFLRKTTVVGLLPAPPPVVVRKFVPKPATEQWTSAYTWGVLFMHGFDPAPIVDISKVTLFKLFEE